MMLQRPPGFPSCSQTGKPSDQMRRCRGFIFYSFLLRQTKKFATPALGLPSVIPERRSRQPKCAAVAALFFCSFLLRQTKKFATPAGIKNALLLGAHFGCREDGIRTHDTLVEYTHFPGVRLRPLGHLSIWRLQRTLKKVAIENKSAIFIKQF